MSILRFATNVPVEVRLSSLQGKLVESKFGGNQHMFIAEEGMFYVSEAVGRILVEQFEKLGIRPGDPIDICKTESNERGGRRIQWVVSRDAAEPEPAPAAPAAPPQPPSQLESQLAASIQMVQARKQAATAVAAAPAASEQPRWAQTLAMQTRHLVDVYAELVNYAGAKHGNAVRPEDIRNLMTTAFISLSKGANSNAA